MTPAYSEPGISIYQGNCLDLLSLLPPQSVNCVVTSPPYWGLRDYEIAPQVWGGDPVCSHDWASLGRHIGRGCSRCGAWLGSFGLEPDHELYVEHAVQIFDAVWRVLKDDGTLWLNVGDSSAADGGTGLQGSRGVRYNRTHTQRALMRRTPKGGVLKCKDIVGMPWRVALALQAAGWYLRADIIWHKPNPMPESVKDRPTKSHEYIFLLSKSEQYFYDWKAVAEPVTGNAHSRGNGVNPKSVQWAGLGRRPKQNASFSAVLSGPLVDIDGDPIDTRNKRSVWTIPTESYPGAHFATFPRALPRTCILAGCPAGGVVLDPFSGSGTSLEVAKSLGCSAIGLELNPEYIQLAAGRLAQSVLDLVDSSEKGGRAARPERLDFSE